MAVSSSVPTSPLAGEISYYTLIETGTIRDAMFVLLQTPPAAANVGYTSYERKIRERSGLALVALVAFKCRLSMKKIVKYFSKMCVKSIRSHIYVIVVAIFNLDCCVNVYRLCSVS